MTTALKRRLALGAAGFVVFIALLLGGRVLLGGSETWLSERIHTTTGLDWPEPDQTELNRLIWTNPDVALGNGRFMAERIELTFSPLSVLLGHPEITDLTLDQPLWLSDTALSSDNGLALARLVDALAPQRLTARKATIATDDHEWNDIQAAADRLGGSQRFHWQISAHRISDAHRLDLTAGAIVRLRDDELILNEASGQWVVTRGPWRGSWRTGLRAGTYAQGQWSLEYLSWSGQWPEPGDALPGMLEWAGAVEQAEQLDTGWHLAGLDTALAFLDDNDVPQRAGALSSDLTIQTHRIEGQLALSYRSGSEGQDQNTDMTVAVEGRADWTEGLIQWQDPAVLIGLSQDNRPTSLQFDAERLRFDVLQRQWRLIDGEWREDTADQPIQSFGFGVLSGSWPGLALEEAPAVADRLTDRLRPLGAQLEWTDALRRALVSTTGS